MTSPPDAPRARWSSSPPSTGESQHTPVASSDPGDGVEALSKQHGQPAAHDTRLDARMLPHHPGLDGLRAVSLIAVLLYHGDIEGVRGGFLGVSVFFTLSGYLIASLLLSERRATGSIDLRRFWSRRARRLLPALGASLVLAIAYTAIAGEPDQLAQLRGDILSSLAYVTNWHLIARGQSYADWFVAPSPVLHLWSLAIEEQFYLVFPPLLAAALRRWSLRRTAGVVFALVLASSALAAVLHQPGLDTTRVYFGTDTRAAELLVGVLLAMMIGLRPPALAPMAHRLAGAGGILGAVVLGLLCTTAGTTTPWLFHGGLLATALSSALVIHAVVRSAGPVPAILAWRPLRLIGLVSYGAYLYHWPIFGWLSGTTTGLSTGPLLVLRCTATFALALLSFVLLERPVRVARVLPAFRAPLALAAATCVVAALTVAVTVDAQPSLLAEAAADEDRPPPLPAELDGPALDDEAVTSPAAPGAPSTSMQTPTTAEHGPETSVPTPSTTAPGAAPAPLLPPDLVHRPLPTPEHDPPRILVVGDSVATTLGKGLEQWAKDTGDAIVWPTWRFGCGIMRGGDLLFASGVAPMDPACNTWATDWAEDLDRFDPDVVVVLSGVWDLTDRVHPRWDGLRHIGDQEHDRYLIEEYLAAVDLLSSRGATVVWLTAPCVGDRSLPGPLTGTAAFDAERIRMLNERIIPRLLAARTAHTRGIDLFDEICPGGAYEQRYRDVAIARPDGLHFERDGARAIADWLMPQLLDGPDPSAEIVAAPISRSAS